MKHFDVPDFYRSPIIASVKEARRALDPRKKDLSPSILDFGPVRFKLARHFGFCYGVENAIDIVYRALEENPGHRIFLLSEIIHNPHVNDDLLSRGVRFIRTSNGEQLIDYDELDSDDLVIVPAFGTSLEVQAELKSRGIDPYTYDTTCPFVEKVWNKSRQIGRQNYTVVIHGKRFHEETTATFSHARVDAPVVVVRGQAEARELAALIRGERTRDQFFARFEKNSSDGFDPVRDLARVGVVNQTTMLATETREIVSILRQAMIDRYGFANLGEHFADTSDTLCYATNENQSATRALIADGGDIAVIVGGYNSSNTGHLVELCAEAMPTYFINGPRSITSRDEIEHFDVRTGTVKTTRGWIPAHDGRPIEILLTAGASCPDALLDKVVRRLIGWFPEARSIDQAVAPFIETHDV